MSFFVDVLPPELAAWMIAHRALLGWVSLASVLLFAGSLAGTSWLLTRLPSDYFTRHRAGRPRSRWHLFVHVGRNVVGVLFVLAGVVMLVLPGQGLLTILVGLLLVHFPGKRALLCRLLRRPAVRTAIDRLRHRAGREPLALD